MPLLTHEEWVQLDQLLAKCGVTGFYGLTDRLKNAVIDLSPNLRDRIAKNNDLLKLTDLLLALTAVYGADTSTQAKKQEDPQP